MTNGRPITQIRLGAIRASIWANETPNGTRHNVTVGRIYQKDGEWKTSGSFGQDEVLILCKALDLAYMWMAEHRRGSAAASASDSGPEPVDYEGLDNIEAFEDDIALMKSVRDAERKPAR